jgi:adenine/guanine phosphoribosyltransferase-like PRPP-binding protein
LELAPHEYWQTVHPAGSFRLDPPDGFSTFYPAALPDGRQLLLPIRPLPGGDRAVASLIVNQASFEVEDVLADAMAAAVLDFAPDVVIGVPTLGLPLASAVARRLGHRRIVALGTSRQFWYDDALSEPLSSITSPAHGKRIYIDPRMLPLLVGWRVLVVDDVLSTGASMASVLRLLATADVEPVAIATAMHQTDRWRTRLSEFGSVLADRAVAPMRSPMFVRTQAGRWQCTA